MTQTNEKLAKRLTTAREKFKKIAKSGKAEDRRAAHKQVKRVSRKIAAAKSKNKNAARSRKKAD